MGIISSIKKSAVAASFGAGVLAGAGGTFISINEKELPTERVVVADAIRPAKKDLVSVADHDTTYPDGSVGTVNRTDTVDVPSDRVYPAYDARAFVGVGEKLTVTVDDGDSAVQWVLQPETPTYAIISAVTMAGEDKPKKAVKREIPE